MTSALVVETSVTNNSSFQDYTYAGDHTIRSTDNSGFKPAIYYVNTIVIVVVIYEERFSL